jgi:hypothetical protein
MGRNAVNRVGRQALSVKNRRHCRHAGVTLSELRVPVLHLSACRPTA